MRSPKCTQHTSMHIHIASRVSVWSRWFFLLDFNILHFAFGCECAPLKTDKYKLGSTHMYHSADNSQQSMVLNSIVNVVKVLYRSWGVRCTLYALAIYHSELHISDDRVRVCCALACDLHVKRLTHWMHSVRRSAMIWGKLSFSYFFIFSKMRCTINYYCSRFRD